MKNKRKKIMILIALGLVIINIGNVIEINDFGNGFLKGVGIVIMMYSVIEINKSINQ